MASFKVILSFAVLAACMLLVHAEEPLNAAAADAPQPVAPQPLAPGEKEAHQRDKKFVYIPTAYAAYGAPAYPAVTSYAYSYQKALPYAYGAAYYPYPYSYPYLL